MFDLRLVREAGFEPAPRLRDRFLRPARLPVPPLARSIRLVGRGGIEPPSSCGAALLQRVGIANHSHADPWCARRDSNPQHPGSRPGASAKLWATRAGDVWSAGRDSNPHTPGPEPGAFASFDHPPTFASGPPRRSSAAAGASPSDRGGSPCTECSDRSTAFLSRTPRPA